MKLRYLHSAGKKHDLPVFMTERRKFKFTQNNRSALVPVNGPGSKGNGHGRGCFAEVAFEFGVKRSGR